MLFLLTLHSILRWLVILVALAAIVKLVIGLIKQQDYDKTRRCCMNKREGRRAPTRKANFR